MGCYCCFNLCILIAHVLVNFVSKAIHLFSLSLSSCPFVTHSFGYPFSFLLFCKTFFHSFAFERKTLLELRPVYRAAPHFNFVINFFAQQIPWDWAASNIWPHSLLALKRGSMEANTVNTSMKDRGPGIDPIKKILAKYYVMLVF